MSANFRGQSPWGAHAPSSSAAPGARGTNSKQTRRLSDLDDSSYEAVAEHPPLLKLGIGVCELLLGVSTNIIQVTTSTYAFYAMALGSGVRFDNIADLFHASPFIFTMAFVIAAAIQGFLHKSGQSMSSTLARLRQIQHFNIKATSSRTAVKNAMTLGSLFFVLALVGDVVGDAGFATLYTHEQFFVGAWIIGLTGCSTLLLYDGATRIWGALEDAKDYRAYHRKFATH